MTDDTETGKNKNVDFWMTEESEQMLVKNRVSSASRVKEHGFEITVHQQHRNSTGKDWKRKK